MAGPNGSHSKRGGPPPQWQTESDEQARALEIERWQQRQAQQRGYSTPHQHPAPAPGYAQPPFDPGYPPAGYDHGQPEPAPRAPFGHRDYPDTPDSLRVQDPFASQYDSFPPSPQSREALGQHYDPHGGAGYEPQLAPDPRGGFDPYRTPQPPSPYDGRLHPGLQQGQQSPQGFGHDGHPLDQRADPQSWDLSHYQPGQIPQGYGGPGAFQEPSHAPHAPLGQPTWPPQHGGMPDPHWQHPQHGQGQWQHQDDPHAHGLQPFSVGAPGHFGPHGAEPGFDHLGGAHDPGLDNDEFDVPEEPRRGPSTLLVVGMLVGAIMVGGGLAVLYKQLSSGGEKAKVAELRKPNTPEKVRPKDPGGKTIEHSDKKFLNRLAADEPTDPQRQSDIDGAAKKVSTIPIVVNRDGSLTPQAPQAQQSSAESSGVPGLVLDGFGPPPGPPAAPQLRGDGGPVAAPAAPASRLPPPSPPPPAVAPKAAQAAPAVPKVADLPLPKVIPTPPAATAAVVERPAPPKKKVAVRDDLVSQQAHASAAEDGPSGLGSAVATPPRKPIAATSSSGYVAVLASKKTRQEALNSFADLHSQYPDVLGGLTPDVREANLGEKGLWYRLIVGPPGSREAARNVCVKLKEKGMNDCWPVAY
jgi:hypothetical protein